jgi:hypothetical protein
MLLRSCAAATRQLLSCQQGRWLLLLMWQVMLCSGSVVGCVLHIISAAAYDAFQCITAAAGAGADAALVETAR